MPRGQKICSKCNTPTGPRTKVCETCNTPFTFKEDKPKLDIQSPEETLVEEKIYHGEVTQYNLLFVPGQPSYYKGPFCPIQLENTSEACVLEWLEKMKFYTFDYCDGPTRYSRSAIKYFVRGFVDIDSDEYKKVISIIDNNMEPYKKEVAEGYEI